MLNDFDSELTGRQQLSDASQTGELSRFSQNAVSKFRGHFQSTAFKVESAVNPLVAIATPLLSAATQLAEQSHTPDLHALHESLSHEVKVYEARAQEFGYRSPIILAGRYFICSLLDEIILNRPWKNLIWWQTHTLLNTFQRDTTSDERFFLVLERSAEDPSIYIDVLELCYICLSLGFRGKYRQQKDSEEFDQLIDNLYVLIQRVRGEVPKRLFIKSGKTPKKIYWRLRLPPIWLIVVIAGFISCAIFLTYHSKLNDLAIPVQQAINDIGQAHE